MKTISKHLAILAGLLVLPSSAQGQQVYCDPNGRPVFCTPVYSPVCAYPEGCENSLCSYTAINACAACGQSDVVFYTQGECFYNSTDVYEYLENESTQNEQELEQSGQEEEAGENHEQAGGEAGEGENGEGSLEEGGSGSEEETITPEEGGNPVEEETEQEQPVEQETEEEEEQGGSGSNPGSGTEEPTESENEESTTTPTNPGNSSSNCPTTGVLVFVNGKFIQGTYCCGANASCPSKVSPVCGSLNQCVGSLCRQTKINSCTACQDSNVKLYFPGTCHQLFGDAEANIEPNGGNDGSENSELDTEEEQVENIDDFRLLQFDDELLDIYLN